MKNLSEFINESLIHESISSDFKKSVKKWIAFSEKNCKADKEALKLCNDHLKQFADSIDDFLEEIGGEDMLYDYFHTEFWEWCLDDASNMDDDIEIINNFWDDNYNKFFNF